MQTDTRSFPCSTRTPRRRPADRANCRQPSSHAVWSPRLRTCRSPLTLASSATRGHASSPHTVTTMCHRGPTFL